MPDITMCGGEGCNRRAECYRHRAVPHVGQSRYVHAPIHETMDGKCRSFLPIYARDELRDEEECDHGSPG